MLARTEVLGTTSVSRAPVGGLVATLGRLSMPVDRRRTHRRQLSARQGRTGQRRRRVRNDVPTRRVGSRAGGRLARCCFRGTLRTCPSAPAGEPRPRPTDAKSLSRDQSVTDKTASRIRPLSFLLAFAYAFAYLVVTSARVFIDISLPMPPLRAPFRGHSYVRHGERFAGSFSESRRLLDFVSVWADTESGLRVASHGTRGKYAPDWLRFVVPGPLRFRDDPKRPGSSCAHVQRRGRRSPCRVHRVSLIVPPRPGRRSKGVVRTWWRGRFAGNRRPAEPR
ncbi:MAG: hypothetical protein QG597_5177 [Actinomycetota bacterium]|nr:hypothetical protein [Actinomycetota bacterium]